MPPPYGRYEELRPDELAAIVRHTPVAYWPLGLLEHHGWHLPVGFDGLKAQAICQRLAAATGGLLLPVLWWGGGGGHAPFRWTHYQDESAAAAILDRTVGQLLDNGLRVIVLLAGHYPWQRLLDRIVPEHRQRHPQALILAGTEITICPALDGSQGDHAAREETSFGLALFPELVRMDAMAPGRGSAAAWPGGQAPPTSGRHPHVCFDPDSPRFAQMGVDARQASAAHGHQVLDPLHQRLADSIAQYLRRRHHGDPP